MEKAFAPCDEKELLNRCQHMAGWSLQKLADLQQTSVPISLHRAKGWIGQLIENYLGAESTSQALPDFATLGIELKTVPIDLNGQPIASTYVCTAPLSLTYPPPQWHTSWIRQKLSKVLWVPIEGDPTIPLAERKVGNALLWQLPHHWDRALQDDWEELITELQLGNASSLSAHHGTYLQIRPKAANSRIKKTIVDHRGYIQHTVPKGFYLRRQFTQQIFSENYLFK